MTYFCRLTPGVIPAKAEIQFRSAYSALSAKLDSRLRGNEGVVCRERAALHRYYP